MDSRHGARTAIRHQQRHAIRDLNGQSEGRVVGDDDVSIGQATCCAIRPDDVSTMHLVEANEPGRVHTEGVAHLLPLRPIVFPGRR
jgi:hypothetical protein